MNPLFKPIPTTPTEAAQIPTAPTEENPFKPTNQKNYFKLEEEHASDFLKVFALLIIQTSDNQTIIRPIGGKYGIGINDTIEEADAKYPGCKMKFLEEHCGSAQKYFMPNGVSVERVL